MDKLRTSLLLATAAIAASSIFIPLLAYEKGINYLGIGAIDAVLTLGSIISYYLCGVLSDRLGERAKFVKVGYFVSSILFASQLFMNSLASFLIIQFFAGLSIGIYAYPLVSIVANMKSFKKEVSSLAAYGALGSFAGSAVAALITDVKALFILSALFFLVAFLFSLNIPDPSTPKRHVKLLPLQMLLRDPFVYATNFLRHLGANAFWAVMVLYLYDLGASRFWIAVITALNPLVQFFLMKYVGELLHAKKIEENKLIFRGALGSMFIFIAYLMFQNFYFALAIALLVAYSWSSLNVGSTLLLASRNAEKATVTGLLGSVLGLAQVLGLFIGGAIAQLYGINATLDFAIAACFLSVLASRKI